MALKLKCPDCRCLIESDWTDKLATCPGCQKEIHRDEAYSYSVRAATRVFLNGKVRQAFKAMARVLGSERQCSDQEERLGHDLLDYHHPHLKNVDARTRQQFTEVTALRWLYRQFGIPGYWLCNTEPLAVLLGHDYFLEIEPERMCVELHGQAFPAYLQRMDLPIAYDRRLVLWPELRQLTKLSLAARTVFIRCMRYVQVRSGLSDFNRAMALRSADARQGLSELDMAGLMVSSPSPSLLLTELTLGQLKDLAFEKGIGTYRRKQWLIERISENLPEAEIMDHVAKTLPETTYLVQPLIGNDLLLLKRLLFAEQERLSLYRRWVRDVVCLKMPQPPPREPEPEPWLDKMKPWMRPENFEDPCYWTDPYNQNEIGLIAEFWDTRCDEIVAELAEKHAWNAGWFISEAIQAYLAPERLEEFKSACKNVPTHAWSNALMYYGKARIGVMGIPIRQPRILTCAYCGEQFLESSIPANRAKSLGNKILFCRPCYAQSDWLRIRDRPQSFSPRSREEMLQQLSELAQLLEFVPLKQALANLDLGSLSEEKQIKIVRILIEMPPAEDYAREFGSWTSALALAGTLEEAVATERGTRCIAMDGHVCWSIAEKSIDDWFHLRGIPHQKEPLYPSDPILNPNGRMRADWEVDGTLVEYAGLMQEPEYRMKMDIKQQISEKLSVPLIVLYPNDLANLDTRLAQFLRTSISVTDMDS